MYFPKVEAQISQTSPFSPPLDGNSNFFLGCGSVYTNLHSAISHNHVFLWIQFILSEQLIALRSAPKTRPAGVDDDAHNSPQCLVTHGWSLSIQPPQRPRSLLIVPP